MVVREQEVGANSAAFRLVTSESPPVKPISQDLYSFELSGLHYVRI
jgi:hypothetical protein